jgi:hypothetical protein
LPSGTTQQSDRWLCILGHDFVTAISRVQLHGSFRSAALPAITTALSRGLFGDPIAPFVDLTAARGTG